MIEDFAGKTAVLTGAGSGNGLECPHRCRARLGMNLVLVDVQPKTPGRRRCRMTAAGSQVLAARSTCRTPPRWALAADVRDRLAPPFVFNNAGVGAGGLVWENSVADWNWVLG